MTEKHKCDGCGAEAILQSGKRHWCKCNPKAPFYMVPVKITKIVNRVLSRQIKVTS